MEEIKVKKDEVKKEEKNQVKIDNDPDKINFMEKIKSNPWMISTIILGIIVIVLLVMMLSGGITGNVISDIDAGQKIIDFAESRGAEAEIVEVNDVGSLYEVVISINGQELPLYVTKDGEYFIQSAIPLTGEVINNDRPSQREQEPQEIIKSDKPIVELFIMTHCPYGTQAEKGIIPVLELLGDKIDGSIRFVHYMMHAPEETETPIQVCIREEQSDKFLDYLKCFLEEGDTDACLVETKIDKIKLDSCVAEQADIYYESDSVLSEGYGVRGSPSLIINGVQVNSARDSASYLETICSAFNNLPEECNEVLSSDSPSPGFGYSASSSGSDAAQCS